MPKYYINVCTKKFKFFYLAILLLCFSCLGYISYRKAWLTGVNEYNLTRILRHDNPKWDCYENCVEESYSDKNTIVIDLYCFDDGLENLDALYRFKTDKKIDIRISNYKKDDYNFLKNFKKLKSVCINTYSKHVVTDFSFLNNPNLKKLSLSNFSKFSDTSMLSEELETLSLTNCYNVKLALKIPEKIKKLTIYNLTGNGNCEQISKMTNLENLNLRYIKKMPKNIVLNSKKLKEVKIFDCEMDKFPKLSTHKLDYLSISSFDKVSKIDLSNLNNCLIENLNLQNIDNASLATLKNVFIGQLNLNCFNNLKSLEIFKNFKNIDKIKTLTIENCKELTSLKGIERFTVVDKLSIDECAKLSSLDRIEKLIYLTDLSVRDCEKIIDVNPLKKLKKLHHLEINNCDLVNIKPLINLPLSNLDLSYTKVNDFGTINKIKTLNYLSIYGTPLAKNPAVSKLKIKYLKKWEL
ncbi:hypothetical protein AAEX28_07600 [Lentisphaerota bacterium WC36G]|nr:hypothetical protein LJT99_10460 [Lentisphaerae bacterium WC36]